MLSQVVYKKSKIGTRNILRIYLISLDPIYSCLAGTSLIVTTLKVRGQMFQSIHQIICFNPQVNLFTMNSIEIIHASREIG